MKINLLGYSIDSMTILDKEAMDQVNWNRDLANDLKLAVQATKLPPRKLLDDCADIPEGLDKELLIALLGSFKGNVSKSHVDYIYAICQEKSKADQFVRIRKKKYTIIPQDKRDQILSEIQRTGVSISVLLKIAGLRNIAPNIVSKVANGKQQKALEADIDKVLELYALRPDKIIVTQAIYKKLAESYEPISEEHFIRLKKMNELGLLPGNIFSIRKDIPEHLNAAMISSWINKEDQKANLKDVESVLTACEEILKEALGFEQKS
ncbi:MAG: hypothetical protein JXQ90_17950 [Cyclobacteriaceae bacterium]